MFVYSLSGTTTDGQRKKKQSSQDSPCFFLTSFRFHDTFQMKSPTGAPTLN